MDARRQTALHQQRARRLAASTDVDMFASLLSRPDLLDCIEALLPRHRERLFSPVETLSMFMAQALSADRSCRKAVDDLAVKRLRSGSSPCSTRTGGYCRARQRLPVEMVSTLVRTTGTLISSQSRCSWLWMGRPVRLVDGTTVSMPDTAANQAAYPQSRGQKPGLGVISQ